MKTLLYNAWTQSEGRNTLLLAFSTEKRSDESHMYTGVCFYIRNKLQQQLFLVPLLQWVISPSAWRISNSWLSHFHPMFYVFFCLLLTHSHRRSFRRCFYLWFVHRGVTIWSPQNLSVTTTARHNRGATDRIKRVARKALVFVQPIKGQGLGQNSDALSRSCRTQIDMDWSDIAK